MDSNFQLSPYMGKILSVERDEGNLGIMIGGCSYNEKYNMIITCTKGNLVHFYDATTLLPIQDRDSLQVDSPVGFIVFSPEAEVDTCLFGCWAGEIYAYHMSNQSLQRICKKDAPWPVTTLSFVTSTSFVYARNSLPERYIANLTDKEMEIEDQRLLKSVKSEIYIRCLSRRFELQEFCQGTQRYLVEEWHFKRIILNKKEYILGCKNGAILIMQRNKGRVRLLKTIRTEGDNVLMVYLEDYKMIVTPSGRRNSDKNENLHFFDFPSGKLKLSLDVGRFEVENLFFMKDKNCLGVSNYFENIVQIIPLSGCNFAV